MSEDNLTEQVQQNSDPDSGNIKISDEVVSTIASIAASEVSGVAAMGAQTAVVGFAEKFSGKKSMNKGVKVEIANNRVVLDIHIMVSYGARIPEVAWDIQENVKKSVETMTGLNVDKVNIHIEGLVIEKEKVPEPSAPEEKPAQTQATEE